MKYFLFNLLFPITYSYLHNSKRKNKKATPDPPEALTPSYSDQTSLSLHQSEDSDSFYFSDLPEDYILPLTKVLIHKNYGAFGLFSNQFEKEFKNTYGIDLQSLILYDPYHDKMNHNKNINARYDTRIIDLFEKLGSVTSNEDISSMSIVSIPTELIIDFHINEYDGAEWIWCNISKKYKEILFSIMESNNKITHEYIDKIYMIKKCEKYLIDNNIHFV